jgi:hypothetical protein
MVTVLLGVLPVIVRRVAVDRLTLERRRGRHASFSSISTKTNSKALALRTSCSTPAGR